jgi:site-specific DNA recombinase
VELWHRPKLQKLRESIRAREVDVVIAYAIDRLARDPTHLGVLISEAEHNGVEVAFVTEQLDDTREGALIRFVRGYAAGVEHEKIRERTMRGRRSRVLDRGKPLASQRPRYGLAWKDEEKSGWIEDPITGPIARRIWREALEGSTLRSIANGLTRDGIRTPSGRGDHKGPAVRPHLHGQAHGPSHRPDKEPQW